MVKRDAFFREDRRAHYIPGKSRGKGLSTPPPFYEFPAPAVCSKKARARSYSEAIRPTYIGDEVGFALVELAHTSVSRGQPPVDCSSVGEANHEAAEKRGLRQLSVALQKCNQAQAAVHDRNSPQFELVSATFRFIVSVNCRTRTAPRVGEVPVPPG